MKMNIKWEWKRKSELAEQLKFFGAKKKKFVSVYAKKPRILIKTKAKAKADNYLRVANIDRELSALHQHQRLLGAADRSYAYQQMAAAQLGATGLGQAVSAGGAIGMCAMAGLFGGIK